METEAQDQSSSTSVLKHLSVAADSDVGQKRDENQDSFGVIETDSTRIFVVADGMGGVKGGAIASQLAIEVFEQELNGSGDPSSYVSAVKAANLKVFEHGQKDEELAGMGTTFLALCFADSELHIVHVGDSRAYRFRGERVEQLTHDHTLIQELVDSGALSEEQAEDHPVSHMLTRSLGPAHDVTPDCNLMPDGPVKGDRYLLCSDGLYNLIATEELPGFLNGKSNEEAVEDLIKEANARGGTDNITVIIITVGDDYPVTLEDYPDSVQKASLSEDTLELDRGMLQASLANSSDEKSESEEDDEESSPRISASVNLEQRAAEMERLEEERASGAYAQASLEEEPVVAPLPERKRRFLPLVAGAAAALSVVAIVLFQRGRSDIEVVRAPAVKAPEVAPIEPQQEEAKQVQSEETLKGVDQEPELETTTFVAEPAPEEQIEQAIPETQSQVEDTPTVLEEEIEPDTLLAEIEKEKSQLVTRTAVEALQTRQEDLEQRAQIIRGHIELLEAPLSGAIGQLLREVPQRRKEKERELKSVRASIDIATRRLSIWYGRKRRMENSDPLTLSVEVAAISPEVQKAKQEFDQVTWAYLKEAESFRYDPENKPLKQRLLSLRKDRQEQLTQLSRVIKTAIADQIHRADEEISRLTLQRDSLEDELRRIDRDARIARVVASGSQAERSALRQDLVSELAIIDTELRELIGGPPELTGEVEFEESAAITP